MSECSKQKRKTNVSRINMFETDAGQGISNIKQDDLALPFLKVLGSTISRM